MALRRGLARWLVRGLLRPGLAGNRPMAWRRKHAERVARLVPLPRGVRRVPAGAANPGGEWWLPRGARPDSPRGAVLYLHGGGFVLGSPATHRPVAARLALATGVPVLLAEYRLAPEHPFPAGLEDVQEAWWHVSRGGARPVGLAGDSAGGWLALALAQYTAAAGLPQPAGLALFSPLLDLAAAEVPGPADLMLPAAFLAYGARAWRGAIPASDPRLDLLAGPLAGLPPTFLSFDRDERLAADARRLVEQGGRAGVQFRVEEATGLWHAWPLFAGLLPEAERTLAQAAAMLLPASAGTAS